MITKRRNISFILFFLMVSMSAFIIHAQDNSLGQLNQYISDLQKNPNDYTLREKIIKLAQEMKPAPTIPLEAERYEGRAEFAIKNAKSEADFLDAAKEYGKALLIAPWVSAYYFNQGIAYEKGGNLKEAKQSFEFYLLTAPNAQDAKEVRKRIAGLEYAMEKATKESSPTVIAEKKQKEFEDLLKKIDGRRYTCVQGIIITMDVRGKEIVFGFIKNGTYYEYTKDLSPHVVIQGRETTVDMLQFRKSFMEVWAVEATYIISEDGDKKTQRIRNSNGAVSELICLWQR